MAKAPLAVGETTISPLSVSVPLVRERRPKRLLCLRDFGRYAVALLTRA